MTAAVRIDGLRRHFPGAPRPAVADLSLEVAAGTTLCLVGPSGCGKSTTLRMLAGLEAPDTGRVFLGDQDVTSVAPRDRDVAMVFQGFALYPQMRVRDILTFPLRMRGVAPDERASRVDEVAALLEIGPLLDRRPPQLSGGEQQRVAMGRAIVRRPAVFLFDEPLSNLDAALRQQLRGELGKLLRTLGATAVYVTHDQAEAMTLGHEVAVLRAGKVEQLASPRTVYREPANTFVAGFFGVPPMNLVTVVQGEPAPVAGLAHRRGLPATCLAGIRPERVRLGTSQESNRAAGRGTVHTVETLGAETVVELDVAGAPFRVRAPGFESLDIGEVVSFSFDLSDVRWFDGDSGAALPG